MFKEIDVRDALGMNAVFIDVRSEKEHAESCIPGAINIPIFNDDERRQVGIAYKQMGLNQARDLGLELVAPKMPSLVSQIRGHGGAQPIIVYCWRGGLRSNFVALLLQFMGLKVYRLIGGYKAYRRHINEFFSQSQLPYRPVLVSGLTGSGKTDVLLELVKLGQNVLDLEGLANNRGSVFGAIGLGAQPTQKDFEAGVYKTFQSFNTNDIYAVECESKRIGGVFLPPVLWENMQSGSRILLYAPLEVRVERLVDLYFTGPFGSIEGCKSAIISLTKRLGKETVELMLRLIDDGQYFPVVEKLLVDYYDPMYKYPSGPDSVYQLCIDSTNINAAAESLKEFMNSQV